MSTVTAVRARARRCARVGLARGDRRRVDRGAGGARPPNGRAVDHGRRDRLLRAREERRRPRAVPRPRGSLARLRVRLPGADRPRLAAVRLDPGRLHRGEGDQQRPHVADGDPGLLARAPPPAGAPRPRRRDPRRARPLDALHGDADDGERLLPALRARRVPPRRDARAADAGPAGSVCSRSAGSRSRRAPRRSRSSPRSPARPSRSRSWSGAASGPGCGPSRRSTASSSAARSSRWAATAALGHSPLDAARRLPCRDVEHLHGERGPPLLPLPRRRARPLPRHPAFRRPGRACGSHPGGRLPPAGPSRSPRSASRSGSWPRSPRSRPRATSTGSRSGTCSTSLPSRLIALLGLAADGVVPLARRPRPGRGGGRRGAAVLHPVHPLHHDERGLRHLRAPALVVGAGPPDPPRPGALGGARRLARRRGRLRAPPAPLRPRPCPCSSAPTSSPRRSSSRTAATGSTRRPSARLYAGTHTY